MFCEYETGRRSVLYKLLFVQVTCHKGKWRQDQLDGMMFRERKEKEAPSSTCLLQVFEFDASGVARIGIER